MSKALPVYELSQWIASDRNVGYIVARMSAASVWEVREDYKGREEVERFKYRGAGYVVQWVDLCVTSGNGPHIDVSHPDEIGYMCGSHDKIVGSVPRRLNWLMAATIAEKRYQPCENPVEVPVVQSDSAAQIELEQAICAEESQPALPLDIDAATEATMRAAVALGNQAADWLRAKGLTP